MSSKKDSQAAATNGTKYEARLCHVVKRADFDGYGFNLHAEKGRPGQYIGKVDDGSPAEAAGLRQGDRIIEVNGTNITTETHKKVVELIKGVPNETKLLVIDPRADAADLKAAIAKSKTDGVNGGVDVNDNSKQPAEDEKSSKMTNGTKGDSMMMAMENNKPHDVNGKEEMNNKRNSDMSANKATNGDASPKQQQKPAVVTASVDHIIEDTKALSVSPSKVATTPMTTTPTESKKAMNGSSNGSSAATATNGSASKEGPKLNLNMTAAELRAQLAARKKYDPKNDVCDLRKKYEIIQKM
uniref:Putative sry n=1 Tax=Aedes albopictus TaxID=7160 RepID=A0A023EMT8_AEDAL